MRLLLGSGGLSTGARRSAWRRQLKDFLGPDVRRVLFVPWALKDHDRYVKLLVRRQFAADREVTSIHRARDPKRAVTEAEAIYVGGGNSWRLLDCVQRAGLLPVIRRRVRAGLPYVGISAGTNLACPTIRTTNDMQIIAPGSPAGLGVVPFQINPHFTDGAYYVKDGRAFIRYGGETREERLLEFLEENDTPVLALREGEILRVEGTSARLVGLGGARLYVRGRKPKDVRQGSNLSRLLNR